MMTCEQEVRKKPVWQHWGLGALCILLMLSGCARWQDDATDPRDKATPVTLAAVETHTFTRKVSIQGTWAAAQFALVPARIGGVLDDILVEDGATVTNGQALARIDAEQLEHAVESRRQERNVARSALAVAEAQAERTATDLERAQNDHRRFTSLREDDAVSEQAAEQITAQWKAALAADKVARAQIALAEAQVQQAASALAITQRDLRDTVIRAPIGGAISQRLHEMGESVASHAPVFRIDDPSVLEFSAFLAERYYPLARPGTTRVSLRAADRPVGELVLSYRAPTVHEQLRTFEVKCRLPDPPAWLAPGMMAQATLELDRRAGRGVPAGAIVQQPDGPVLFTVENGHARARKVTIGYQTDGMTEILEGLPAAITHVIVSGQSRLNDGDSVTIPSKEADDVSR